MNEAWFFVGLFAFIFLLWIAIGGPTRGVSFGLPAVTATSVSATAEGSTTGSYFSLPQAPFAIGQTEIHLPGSSSGSSYGYSSGSGSGYGYGSTNPLITVPGVTFPATSPYRGRVSLAGSVGDASSSDPGEEYVEIYAADDGGAPIDITGWELLSGATYKYAYIPQGTAIPASGIVNPTSDIYLRPGDTAIITSGESPVGGSFRENECTGYFGSTQSFTPSLSQSCPSANTEMTTYYGKPYIHDPDCINYTRSLGTCRMPTAAGEANLNLTCQDFLDTYLNYSGCLAAHQGDAGFVLPDWRIYLGRKPLSELPAFASVNETRKQGPLWRASYDVVELLDREGRIVDAFTYD
ncbi:MAG: hypothetical protein KGI78_01945 [Patescibacteria group bacterium]|nr:hypothetical protein [Patescibacteria group bacterium]MDE1944088.1 hypothetical protein [Patescibacteria group bacterium]MDE1944705.1 hypothetical protein [Patescibacteria group bacterium]MDE2057596.1 hypothetical protein [Patescibacteria group bacterium]